MLTREKILETVKKLPETVSLEEVLDRIILLEKIETGLEESKQNKVLSEENLHQQLPEWLQ